MARISSRSLAQLCRRTGEALRAGLDVRGVWDKETQRGTPRQRLCMQQVRQQVGHGDSVAEAMRGCNGFFPPLVCEMVDVGEQSGHLDEILLQLADYYEHVLEVRRGFLGSIAWPVLQLGMGVVIVAFLILILGMLGSEVDVLGLGLGTGLSLLVYFLGIFGFAGMIAVAVVAVQRQWLGEMPLTVAMSIPVLSGAVQSAALSRFSMSLGMALDAGMDVLRAVQLSLASTQNPQFLSEGKELERRIRSGDELHQALRDSGVFPDPYLEMFETGEASGQLPEVLARLSLEYRQRFQTSLKALVVAVSILIWIMITALLIFVIIRLFITLYLSPIREALEGI